MPSALLLPLPRFVAFYPGTGAPLAGGFVRTYVPGTSTPKQTYQDPAASIINPFPLVLDSAGSALMYGIGAIEIRTTDALGNAIPGYSGVVSGTPPSGTAITGYTLSNNIAQPQVSLDIAAGSTLDGNQSAIITQPAGLTKTILGAWSVGNGAPGMGNTVVRTPSTWYHVFAIINAGTADVYFDNSVIAANAPSSTSAHRRIGSFKLDASGNILKFAQYGNRFDWATPILEITGLPLTTAAVTKNLIGVPPGVTVAAMFSGAISDSTTPQSLIYFSSLAQTDLVPAGPVAITGITGPTSGGTTAFSASVMTNTLAQIRYRLTSATTAVNMIMNGWTDQRVPS